MCEVRRVSGYFPHSLCQRCKDGPGRSEIPSKRETRAAGEGSCELEALRSQDQ